MVCEKTSFSDFSSRQSPQNVTDKLDLLQEQWIHFYFFVWMNLDCSIADGMELHAALSSQEDTKKRMWFHKRKWNGN